MEEGEPFQQKSVAISHPQAKKQNKQTNPRETKTSILHITQMNHGLICKILKLYNLQKKIFCI